MPDWLAPFTIPKLTDAEYAKQKAEYTAKHGYTITVPGLSDIIKIRTEDPMTALENYWWKRKQWDKFSPKRLAEVGKQKEKRRARYLAMLASPTPAIAQNAGSIMTSIDDAQDAISTMAAIGQLGRKVAPKVLGKALAGPVGALMVASDVLNLVQATAMRCMVPKMGKRDGEQLARGSPKTLKHKLKSRFNMKAKLPGKADWIQGLQTSEQVFGFGISLGPIVGLAQDIFLGYVRTTRGDPPKIKIPVPDLKYFAKAAYAFCKTSALLFGGHWETDDEDCLLWFAAAQLSFQMVFSTAGVWNPLENVENIEDLEIKAPEPWHQLTKEVINEGPMPPQEVMGWPQTGSLWARVPHIIDRTQDVAVLNWTKFQDRNKNSWAGWLAGNAVREASGYALACLEGAQDVYYEHWIPYAVATTMMENGIFLDPHQDTKKFELFTTFLEDCEETLWNPSLANIKQFCSSPWNDIKLIQQTTSQI